MDNNKELINALVNAYKQMSAEDIINAYSYFDTYGDKIMPMSEFDAYAKANFTPIALVAGTKDANFNITDEYFAVDDNGDFYSANNVRDLCDFNYMAFTSVDEMDLFRENYEEYGNDGNHNWMKPIMEILHKDANEPYIEIKELEMVLHYKGRKYDFNEAIWSNGTTDLIVIFDVTDGWKFVGWFAGAIFFSNAFGNKDFGIHYLADLNDEQKSEMDTAIKYIDEYLEESNFIVGEIEKEMPFFNAETKKIADRIISNIKH